MASVLILASGFAFIAAVSWQLLVNGPFLWHVRQPAFWQGGLEALLLMAALGALQLLPQRGLRLVLSFLLAEIYLRRHAVDAAVLVDVLYLELMMALGMLITRLSGVPKPDDIVAYLRAFVLGFCAWSVCAWTSSAFGLGSLRDLRWLTLVLVLPALAARARPWSVFVVQRVYKLPPSARVAAGVLLGWLFVLFARSATAIGFDDQWYALRGDHVLVGEGSAFITQGLVAPVYYFPKVYELFLVPLSGLGSTSVIVGMTILILGLFGAAGYELLRQLGVRSRLQRIIGVALFISLPAVANIALEAKPDLLAAFLLSLAWLSAAQFIASRSSAALLWLLGLLMFSSQAKLTAIPFAAGLFLATAIALVCTRPSRLQTKVDVPERRLATIAFAILLIITAFATARTLLLTGMPTIGPDPLVKLWQALGFQLQYPVGSLQWSYPKDWADTPALLLDVMFRPQNLTLMVITWIGNVWLWLGLVTLGATLLRARGARFRERWASSSGGADALSMATADSTSRAIRWPGRGLMLIAFCLLLCWGFGNRGGDGNYFIAGIVPAVLLGFAAALRSLSGSLHRPLLVACAVFCVFAASYSFVNGWWIDGTRGFDADFRRSARIFRHESRLGFRAQGISRIAEHLRRLHSNARVVGCTEFGGALGFHLPARFEDIASITSRPEFSASKALFADFLKTDHIDYLLAPRAEVNPVGCTGGKALALVAADLAADASIPALQDERYVLYDIRSWQKK
jgi:hypothetical protein